MNRQWNRGGVCQKLLPQLPQLLEFTRYVEPKWYVAMCYASNITTWPVDDESSVDPGGGGEAKSCYPNYTNCLNSQDMWSLGGMRCCVTLLV